MILEFSENLVVKIHLASAKILRYYLGFSYYLFRKLKYIEFQ